MKKSGKKISFFKKLPNNHGTPHLLAMSAPYWEGKTLVRRACNVRLWKKLHEISVKSPRNLGEIYEKSLHLSTQTSEDIKTLLLQESRERSVGSMDSHSFKQFPDFEFKLIKDKMTDLWAHKIT